MQWTRLTIIALLLLGGTAVMLFLALADRLFASSELFLILILGAGLIYFAADLVLFLLRKGKAKGSDRK